MTKKIKTDKNYPFFNKYHDIAYIQRHDCSKIISLHEPKENRYYKLKNNLQKEIIVYQIDKGIINNNNELKCDYGIYTEDDHLFLIELKGTDLDHALNQINSTIEILLKKTKIKVSNLNIRIVLSKIRVPKIYATKEKKLKHMLIKEYGGGDYKKQCRFLQDSI